MPTYNALESVADLAEQRGNRAAQEEQRKNGGNGDQTQDQGVLGKTLTIPTLDASQDMHDRDSDKTGRRDDARINE
jgi:hypothetical protein